LLCNYDILPPQTVKLVKTRVSINANSIKPENQDGDIVSIALVQDKAHGGSDSNGAPSPKVGQAYSMAVLFDALVDGNYDILAPIIDPNIASSSFKPQQQVVLSDKYQLRNARIHDSIHPDVINDTMAQPVTSCTLVPTKSRVEPVRNNNVPQESNVPIKGSKTTGNKITTAASFFQATKTNDNLKTSKNISNSSLSSSSIGEAISEPKPNTSIITKLPDSRHTITKEEKENVKNISSTGSTHPISPKTKSTQEATAVPPPPSVASKVGKGFVDDFVGDQDEDEEFLRLEEERMKRLSKDGMKEKEVESTYVTTTTRSEHSRIKSYNGDSGNRGVMFDDDLDDDSKNVAMKGAMDMFSTKLPTQHSSQSGAKRRKQVLEERTYQDERGYLKTETVYVWKECDDPVESHSDHSARGEGSKSDAVEGQDKAPVEPNRKSSTSSKNSKSMKQSNISGFFTVKK